MMSKVSIIVIGFDLNKSSIRYLTFFVIFLAVVNLVIAVARLIRTIIEIRKTKSNLDRPQMAAELRIETFE